MKKPFFRFTVLIVLFLGFSLHAQDFSHVDSKVGAYPDSFSSLDKFADRINADFTKDDEKARAIFTWVAHHVVYDIGKYGVNERPVGFSYRTEAEKLEKLKELNEDLAKRTLKTQKGVCQGYCALFVAIAERTGLEAVIIPGTSKSNIAHIGDGPGAKDHAWNTVKINGEWKLLDLTWGAGTATGSPLRFEYNFNDSYFFTNPDIFFLNHFPDEKKWLLTNKTENDFAGLPLYFGNYHKGKYELLSPQQGMITDRRANTLLFKIRNIKPQDTVVYAFSKSKQFKLVKPVFNGNIAEFKVPLEAGSNGYLMLYINEKSVLAYRINRG